MPIAQLIAGVAVASAVIRWGATLRTSGWRALPRALGTARLRWVQYRSTRWAAWIAPAGLVALLVLAQLTIDGWANVSTIAGWLFVAALAIVLTFSCPPVLLFLGSSEPGTYRYFHYLTSRHSWITIGALKDWDLRATEIDDYRRSMSSRLIPRRWRRRLRWLAPPTVESLRASDAVWELVVREALRLCEAVLLDLRSGGLFVRHEFLAVVQSGAIDRTVAIVRDDGTSCIDALIDDRPEIMKAFRSMIQSEELRQAVHAGWTPLAQPPQAPGALPTADLAVTLAGRLEQRTTILEALARRIAIAQGPDSDLDRAIVTALARHAVTDPVPAVTGSAEPAVAFIVRTAPDAQFSVHMNDHGLFGAGVGRECILGSFRTVMSARADHATSGLALMDALVQSELGHGIGTGELTHVPGQVRLPQSNGGRGRPCRRPAHAATTCARGAPGRFSRCRFAGVSAES